ncbi:MAG: hypothetical protein JO267_13835 [Alphaproteobacteria bacterium]|nr:hypothetical protein [Alphaproteobacteria bacterium]
MATPVQRPPVAAAALSLLQGTAAVGRPVAAASNPAPPPAAFAKTLQKPAQGADAGPALPRGSLVNILA